jgi:hypothetical protein
MRADLILDIRQDERNADDGTHALCGARDVADVPACIARVFVNINRELGKS